jgi:hypothetical protein
MAYITLSCPVPTTTTTTTTTTTSTTTSTTTAIITSYSYSLGSIGYATNGSACSDYPNNTISLYADTDDVSIVNKFYTNPELSSPYDGSNLYHWYKSDLTSEVYSAFITNTGDVGSSTNLQCS